MFEGIGAVSILFNRTRIFGFLLLSVILGNIIIQDYLYEISALPATIYYHILVLLILTYDFEKLKKVIIGLFTIQTKDRNVILLMLLLLSLY